MRKKEALFVSSAAKETALQWGRHIQAARLALNLTQAEAAERGRMSMWTWLRIEKGNVSVSQGAWLSAFEVVGILGDIAVPEAPSLSPAKRLRARPSESTDDQFNF